MSEATQSQSRSARLTTEHETIRRWAGARGGRPARVKSTGRGRDDPGILRIDLPGDGPDPNLEPISWDEWFRVGHRDAAGPAEPRPCLASAWSATLSVPLGVDCLAATPHAAGPASRHVQPVFSAQPRQQ
jgi:hypothetical protein